jgi:tetratricopeptide (TPR) repeat protein
MQQGRPRLYGAAAQLPTALLARDDVWEQHRCRRGLRMAGVFLSYDRDDVDKARPLALALEKAGHSVWWDLHVRGGAQFSKVIEEALKAADVVVVLWSASSVDSAWVRDEAAAGRDSGRLVPATIDGTEPPLGFRQFQTIGLTDWKRGSRGRGYKELEQAIAQCAKEVPSDRGARTGNRQPGAAPRFRPRWRWFATALLAVAVLAAGLAAWRYSGGSSSVPIVVVAPADRSADPLARDLLVKLGSLQAAKSNTMRLVGAEGREQTRADFIFEISGSGSPHLTKASLTLLSGRDRTLLWSKDFRLEAGSQGELEQQLAYTAGQVLDCAVDASQSGRIDQDTSKLFLNGCALFAEKYRTDPQAVVPIFEKIIQRAPRFEPAWRKLLLAEVLFTRTERNLGRRTPGDLPSHIAAARKLNPDIPELYLAESVLVPQNAFARRSELLEHAVHLDPDNPDLLLMRVEFHESVGRMGEVVEDATRAVELNPLSPGLRSHMIADLTYAGHIDTAREELRRAEELWPGSAAINDASWRLNSRYGDPKLALTLLRSGALGPQPMISQTVEPFLIARIDPTERNVERALAAAQSRASTDTRSFVDLLQAAAAFHREKQMYQLLLHWPRTAMIGTVVEVFFRPAFREFRQDARFMLIAKRTGLVDYWRKSGKWPDFCFEPDLPYDCKKEAAKLTAAVS